MSVESGVFSLLVATEDLATAMGLAPEVLASRIRRAGAADDIPSPCLVVRWEAPTLLGNLATPSFTLRAHVRDDSYDVIDDLLNIAKTRLTAVVHEFGITQIDWRGRSPDLVDDGYKTLTKYDTYVVAAGLATRGE